MAGRPPKPTQLKVVGGNAGKRALNKQEPDPEYLGDLTPPAWLPISARNVWNEIAPKLRSARVLTEVDVELLAQGCVAISHYRRAVKKAGAELVTAPVEDEEGEVIQAGGQLNPWLIVQSMSFKQTMAVFREFGMSPAARTRIAIQPQGDLFDGQSKEAKYF